MTRKIKVMADYFSSGLWNVDTCEMVDPQDLKLSADLIQELSEFCQNYDKYCEDWKDPDDRQYAFDYTAHTAKAKDIATKIKGMCPHLTVYYFDEAALAADINISSKKLLIQI